MYASVATRAIMFGRTAPHAFPWTTDQKASSHRKPLPTTINNIIPNSVDNRSKFTAQAILSGDDSTNDIYSARPNFAQETGGKKVLTNYFTVHVDESLKLYKYVLCGDGITTKAPREKRKDEMEQFIRESDILKTRRGDFVTDNLSVIFAWKELYGNEDRLEKDIILEAQKVKVFNRQEHPKNIGLQFSGTIDIATLKNHVNSSSFHQDNYESIVQALNTLVLRGAMENVEPDFQSFQIGNKFFRKSGDAGIDPAGPFQRNNDQDFDPVNSLLICHRGYFSTIAPGMGNILLNLNTVMSVFYRPMSLDQFIKTAPSYFNIPHDAPNLTKILHGIRVWVNYDHANYSNGKPVDKSSDPSLRIKTINGFGAPLSTQTFMKKDKTTNKENRTTVLDHFKEEYGDKDIDKYQKYLSVNLGTKTRPLWYPPNKLRILPYQPFRPKLPSQLQRDMIAIACRDPETNKIAIMEEGLRCMALVGPNGQKFLNRVGVRISPRIMDVPCRQISYPQIVVRDDKARKMEITPSGNAKWDMIKKKYLSTPNNSTTHIYYIHTWSALEISRFHKNFFDTVLQYLDIPKPNYRHKGFNQGHRFTDEDFARCLQDASKGDSKLTIFISEDDCYYKDFKQVADQQEGIQSICLRTKSFQRNYSNAFTEDGEAKRFSQPHNSFSNYVANVAMKINLKLGGTNHEPKNMRQLCSAVKGSLMLLGADVTHPSPGSTLGIPSVAGVVGSVDKLFSQYRGSLHIQYGDPAKSAKENIEYEAMEKMVKQRLNDYKDYNGYFPDKIIYYRDGVSKGQYEKIMDYEVDAIKNACVEMGTDSRVTVVITTKRHHTRLYPGQGPDACQKVRNGPQNVLPGTTVESDITSPAHFDFFLVSHDGIKGTSRPTHYTVLMDEIGFDAKGIQDFTNALCYTYIRALMPVSYAPPAYYADRLCDRARIYLKKYFDGSYQTPLIKEKDTGEMYEDWDAMQTDIRDDWQSSRNPTGNPWHEKLNNTMFWM